MLYILIAALITLVAAGMGVALYLNAQAEKKNRLMRVVGGTLPNADKKKTQSADQRRAQLAKKLKDEKDDGQEKKKADIKSLIMQSGFQISVSQYWTLSIALCVFAVVCSYIFGASLLVIGLVAVTSLLGIPKMILKMCAASRQKAFLEDFADALESMMRLLKAGMPVSEAIKMVGREFTGPIGEEMQKIFDEQKIGVSLPDAVSASAERIPIAEMQMFATAVAIQTQTGSSLSEVLQNLATVIRARFRLKRKIQALSSEAKASAGIIGALPCLVAGGMYLINPDYIEVLFITQKGRFVLGAAVFWMFLGIVVMRQMINFKV